MQGNILRGEQAGTAAVLAHHVTGAIDRLTYVRDWIDPRLEKAFQDAVDLDKLKQLEHDLEQIADGRA